MIKRRITGQLTIRYKLPGEVGQNNILGKHFWGYPETSCDTLLLS
jgi:hypothetical protein